MNIIDEKYKELKTLISESKARYKSDWYQVCVMAGRTMVIEAIVREASLKHNVDIDWSFQGGRAFIMADTNDLDLVSEIQQTIKFSIPQINI